METLIQALKAINDVIWGPGMLILLIGTGLYLTVGLRFYTFRNIFSAFSMLWKGRTSSAGDKGELTPFNALMTALGGTIGTGSIVGVATAVLSLPLRYMHTPIETVHRDDLDHTAQLLAAFLEGLGEEAEAL